MTQKCGVSATWAPTAPKVERPASRVDKTTVMRATIGLVGLLVAAPLVTAQTPAQRSAAGGVLVGVYHLEDYLTRGLTKPAVATLRTIWLASEGATATALTPLLVPRQSGFWWMGLTYSCTQAPHEIGDGTRRGDEVYVRDTPWVSPVEAASVDIRRSAGADDCQSTDVSCAGESRTDIYWIWPDFISVNARTEGGCGAHPDSSFDYGIRGLDDLQKSLAVAGVLGSGADARMRMAFERVRADLDKDCANLATFSPTSWHIERMPGRWIVKGWSELDRICGYGIEYSSEVDLSRVIGPGTPPPTWRNIPSTKDAIASPDQRWVLLIRDTDVTLVAREALDRPVATAPLSNDDSIVMVEWAQGPNVARWRNQVRSLGEP